jgi:hypothetical protein
MSKLVVMLGVLMAAGSRSILTVDVGRMRAARTGSTSGGAADPVGLI